MAKTEGKGSVATAMAQTMKAYGVRFVFGIPGNDVLELIRACEAQDIRFVLAKSEPSAGFMEVAKGFGFEAARATTNGEFAKLFEKSRSATSPVLIEAVCDKSEYWDQM